MSFAHRMALCLASAALGCFVGAVGAPAAVASEEPAVTQYTVAGATVVGIAQGPGGTLWFTESYGGNTNVGEVSQTSPSTEITHFPVTSPENPKEAEYATSIASGNDGRVWFLIPNLPTEGDEPATDPGVGEITASAAPAEMKEYALPHAEAPVLENIGAGPDETIWYVDVRNNTINWFPEANPTEVTAIKLEAAGPLHHPEAVTEAPDGSMWIEMDGSTEPEDEGGVVHVVDPTAADPTITEYVFPSEGQSNSYGELQGESLRVDCTGNVWVSAGPDYGIDELDPATSKVTFLQPGASEDPGMPGTLTLAPDQSVWWTEDEVEGDGSGLVNFLPGQSSPFAFLPLSAIPYAMITGSDGNLWLGDGGIAKVALTEAGKKSPATCPGNSGEEKSGGGEKTGGEEKGNEKASGSEKTGSSGDGSSGQATGTSASTSTTTVQASPGNTAFESELTSLGNLANHLLGDLSRVTITKLLRANGGVTVEIPTYTGGTWQVLAESLAASQASAAKSGAAKKGGAVDVIDYKRTFSAGAGTVHAHIGLTSAGRRLLGRALAKRRRLKLRLIVTFTSAGHAPARRTLAVTLKP